MMVKKSESRVKKRERWKVNSLPSSMMIVLASHQQQKQLTQRERRGKGAKNGDLVDCRLSK
jgi:hypothetical protein